MTTTTLGTRDERGEWRPPYLIELPAVLQWPPRPLPFSNGCSDSPVTSGPGTALFLGIALAAWFFLTPDLPAMQRSSRAG